MADIISLAELLKKHGVVGAGGAGFPSYAKLNKKADTVILNCAECEPLFKVHRQVLAMYANEILYALDQVAKAVEAEQVIIAVKDSYKNTITALYEHIDKYKNFSIKKLPEVYPSGDEVVTIYETTGRVVPQGQIPISVGVIVYNVETMLNAYYVLTKNKPVTLKYVTVAGEVENPQTFLVPVGTEISELIEAAGGVTRKDVAYLNGGIMTGNITKTNMPVTKTTNAVLVLPKDHVAIQRRQTKTSINLNRTKSACCQCRMCTDLCPRYLLGQDLQPHSIMYGASNGNTKNVDIFVNSAFCSQCGLCELYSCHQGLSPKMMINVFKTELGKKGIKPEPIKETPKVHPAREYRLVPMERLITRLGLNVYDVKAPINEKVFKPKKVKIMLNQHIGAPAAAVVKTGDKVVAGQVIGEVAQDKLGVNIHSSIDGVVGEVKNGYIIIERTDS
ncbi:MAG: SLBB domain-containing protein [Clostridia bacterium]|nr:SLBB domain-containing protein [Clostridia bacterium]MBQ9997736.1 SLBB domain-containing protein [Clostridia bacterium]